MTEMYARISELSLTIEGYSLSGLSMPTGPNWTRHTTLVSLHGLGESGVGEDVNYDGAEQQQFQASGTTLGVAGTFTLGSFADHLDTLELFPTEPSQAAYKFYRRWAFESAALDLALRQASTNLPERFERPLRPLRFVASLGPASFDPIQERLKRVPSMRFKLDAGRAWDDELVRRLAETGAVDAVDLKGAYVGTTVDLAPDRALYTRVFEAFPKAWIEDPAVNAETEAICAKHRERITWDAPLHSLADITELRWRPRAINVKPSRFGTLAELFRIYEHCNAEGIEMYGGGQFELGAGRDQIQLLASLFHPDSANDTAPITYNTIDGSAPLPASPLRLETRATGFALLQP